MTIEVKIYYTTLYNTNQKSIGNYMAYVAPSLADGHGMALPH